MIAKHLNEILREKSNQFQIVDTAQIEPASAFDPYEIYRIQHGNVKFDVVFYPDRVEIQDTASKVLTQEPTSDQKDRRKVKQILKNAADHFKIV
jgi:hypothetical protein